MIISGPDGGTEDYDPFEPRDDDSGSSSSSSFTTTTSSPADRTSIRGGSSPSSEPTTTETNDDDMTTDDPHLDYLYDRMESRSTYESKRLNSLTNVQGGQENTTIRSQQAELLSLLEQLNQQRASNGLLGRIAENKELVAAGGALAIYALTR